MWALVRQRAFWAGALAGVVIGLILGWFVWPVEYTGAYPSELREQDRLEYLRLVAHDYARTGNVDRLAQHLSTFDEKELIPLFNEALKIYRGEEDQRALRTTLALLRETIPSVSAPEVPTAPPTPVPTPRAQTPAQGRSLLRGLSIFIIVLGVVILGVAVFQALKRVREHAPARQPATPDWVPAPGGSVEEPEMPGEEEAEPATSVEMPRYLEREEEDRAEAIAAPEPSPVAPSLRLVEMFSPVFILQAVGEEGYDEGFTIYEGEENVGECGVGEAESLDDRGGKPIVMEVWLFDKHDTDTHQAYVLSPWAYRQPDIRQKYEDQGAVFEGRHGTVIRLNARTLYLEAEIKDVAYAQLGEGDEVFSKLALEMKVYRRIMPRT